MGHTAVLIGTSLIIFGGRDSPACPLHDLWVLDTVKWQWQHAQCSTNGPQARFRHSAVATGHTLKVCRLSPCACAVHTDLGVFPGASMQSC